MNNSMVYKGVLFEGSLELLNEVKSHIEDVMRTLIKYWWTTRRFGFDEKRVHNGEFNT